MRNRLLRSIARLSPVERGEGFLSDARFGMERPAAALEKAMLGQLKESRKHPGRQELPAHLPRVEKIIPCSPEQCICGTAAVIGYEKSEQLDVEPAK